MKIGEKIKFIQNGKSYVGAFLEEQPHLFDESETCYRISISDSEIKRELGITGKSPLIISSHQVYKDEKSKKKAIKKYPYADIKVETVINSENKNNEYNSNQIDMFGGNSDFVIKSRPKIR